MTASNLLGPTGKPISTSDYARPAKTPKPFLGALGSWAGKDRAFGELPGGGAIQFDTSRLTLADFRLMKEHYQVNSSLSVLTFMLHQLDWEIECDNKEVKDFLTENLSGLWTRLVRALSQAFWSGYSPCALEWENDTTGYRTIINKVKDLYPEECEVNWKFVDGVALPPSKIKPKIAIYDGIRQFTGGVIPVQNTLWYPLMMENGQYYGRKLLKSAFQPWYFSQLMHIFSNRYYERFGEPVPVGRAPYDETVTVDGEQIQANKFMAGMLNMIRNRSAIVLPSDKTPNASGTGVDQFDYTIEYLESQMRGGDFGQYITRLDEEISLALFTPLLLMRTTDGGGYNQGVGHTQVYLWLLNAIAGDWKEYIERYILMPLAAINFPANTDKPSIKFRKLGTSQQETLRSIVSEMVRGGTVKPNVKELGQAIGLSLEEVDVVTDPQADPQADPNVPKADTRVGRPNRSKVVEPRGVGKPRATTKDITARVAEQATKAFKRGTFDQGFVPLLGYRRAMTEALEDAGAFAPGDAADTFLSHAGAWVSEVAGLGSEAFSNDVEEFMKIVSSGLDNMASDLVANL